MEDSKNRIILGLDVSTSTIGVSVVLDDNSTYGKIIELTHVAPKAKGKDGIEALFVKKQIFQEEFLTKWKNCGITDVVIEEPLMRSNNAVVCATLMRFNSMIADSVYNTLGIVPKFISSYHARMFAFPELYNVRKFKRDGRIYEPSKIITALNKKQLTLFGAYPWDIDKKQILQQKVAEIFPEIEWLYDKKNKLKQENYDSVDAYVCVLGLLNLEKYEENTDKITVDIHDITQTDKAITYTIDYWGRTENRTIHLQ